MTRHLLRVRSILNFGAKAFSFKSCPPFGLIVSFLLILEAHGYSYLLPVCYMEVALSCEICANNPHKYRCPRCDMKTCSMSCCLEHKIKFECSGVRDAVVYCRRQEYGPIHFQQDYRLLEEIDRRNVFREKQLAQLSRKNKSKIRLRTKLLKVAVANGISFRLAASPILSRALINRSHLQVSTEGDSHSIVWSVEFNLLSVHQILTQYRKGMNLARMKPLRLVLHECDETDRLMSIWNDRLLQMTPDEQDSSVTYAPPGSPPFGLVASWLYSRVKDKPDSSRYFFYVQAEHFEADGPTTGVTRQFAPVEVFPSNRLSDILITPRLIVHEMPTIWVSRVELN
ncbi:hypothetical protein P879_09925 [Paragonimus westermani]|uniref:HIT-type domain-containing protein n=1 Tax=Paragonimus westermani TaxID=34504 RepID=A0A8T0D5F4_9TREM|nr:hypothetical protein P879_09925 [Paragonimus westermani]